MINQEAAAKFHDKRVILSVTAARPCTPTLRTIRI
jgi:hypothetical protein